MPTIHVTNRDGHDRTVEAAGGQPLMRALKSAGFDEVLALCGGCASCGTCHVYVAEDWLARLSAAGRDELDVLGFSDWRRPNSRLSCQIPFGDTLDGMKVTIAPED